MYNWPQVELLTIESEVGLDLRIIFTGSLVELLLHFYQVLVGVNPRTVSSERGPVHLLL